jgi:hypothetical protein
METILGLNEKKFLSLWYTTAEYRKRYTKEIKKKELVIQPAMSLGHPLVP